MTSHDQDQPDAGDALLDQARGLFERAVGNMPAAEQNRLRLMRRNLLSVPIARGPQRWTLPLGLAASAVVASSLAWFSLAPQGPAATATAAPSELVEAVTAAEDDAQLYAWLGEAPVAVADDGGESL